MESQDILLAPLLTEKASGLTERHNQVSFCVLRQANKHSIRAAVEAHYKVKVVAVRTSIVHGKLRRKKASVGRLPNWKKATVTLNKGDVIDFFATE